MQPTVFIIECCTPCALALLTNEEPYDYPPARLELYRQQRDGVASSRAVLSDSPFCPQVQLKCWACERTTHEQIPIQITTKEPNHDYR